MPISLGTTTITALFLGTTSIVSAYLGSTQVFGGASAFTPLSLFSGGAQGIWLDPSDLSTMFSDRAGTTPVTAPGTVVGMRLDKSKGLVLGSELVTNGTFDTDLSGWTVAAASTGSSSWAAGSMQIAYSSGLPAARYQALSVTAGKTYNLKCVYSVVSGTAVKFFLTVKDTTSVTSGALAETLVTASSGTSGSISFYYTAASTRTVYVMGLIYDVAGTINFDNISVRELAGNHAVAPTDAARPTYGIEPKGGRRNLLTWSEGFDNAAWTLDNSGATNPIVTANFGAAPDGTTTADRIQLNRTGGTFSRIQQARTLPSSIYTFSVWLRNNAAGTANVGIRVGGDAVNCAVTGTWQRFSIATAAASTIVDAQIILYTLIPGTDLTADVLAWGAQLELGSTATNYQRVTTAYDVTESGVATCHYVQYDGSDDSMSTSAINFTTTDKMSVFAGVRKLSDAAAAILLELSADYNANTGSFYFTAPENTAAAGNYGSASRGAAAANANHTAKSAVLLAPISSVLAVTNDIAGDLSAIRVNGAASGTNGTFDKGTGNFGNYAMFIGRRNNATLPFNGRDYGIVIVGKAASSTEITDTETWLAARTSGVTL